MHPVSPSRPSEDEVGGTRLVLRDGSAASVRVAEAADRDQVRRFFHELSPDSRRKRFFTAGEPPDQVVDRLCDGSDPSHTLTLIVDRQVDGRVRPIAVASYIALTHTTAEVAFAVDDRYQGKGIGTSLLDRLAALARRHGFHRFQATTLADNLAMLEVFRDSGFEIRSK